MIRTVVFVLLCTCFMPCWAQQLDVEGQRVLSYIQNAMRYSVTTPQEKVYLHFDNTGYFENETIWFKAYVTRTDNRKATDLSKVLYVELLNPSGDVLKTTKLPIDENGLAYGDLKLDSLYGSGFYEVRAYTRYMTNWGVNACFSRVFPVFKAPSAESDYSNLTLKTRNLRERISNNRDRSDSLYTNAIDEGIHSNDRMKTVSVQFYPEGGTLVKGKKCRVAMLAVDDDGHPYAGNGFVMNESGDVLANVKTDSLGRGLFSLVPDGSVLKFQLKNLRDNTQYYDLPATSTEGVALQFDAVSDDMLVTLQSSDHMCGRLLGYTVINNGNITFCDTVVAEPLLEIELDRSRQREGVNQFTVFDSNGRILAERLFFVCPKPSVADTIRVTSPTQRLKPCGNVVIDVATIPGAHLSFSAIDAQTMNNGRQGNMKTWMLLSSDVKGYISNVDYYFESDDADHRRSADLLMLTQGWRRYDWNMMAGLSQFEKIQPIEDRFYMYGKLNAYRKRNKVSNVNMEVYLYNKAGESLVGTTTTDDDGNYAFALPFMDGEWNVQINTKVEDKNKTYYVGIDRNFSPVARYITPLEASMKRRLKPNITFGSQGEEEEEEFIPITRRDHVLQNVTVKAKRRYFTNDDFVFKNERYGQKYAEMFYDIDKELDKVLDSGEPEPTLLEWLAKKINDLKFDPDHPSVPPVYGLGDAVVFHLDNDERNVAGEMYDLNHFAKDQYPYFDTWMHDVKTAYIAPNSMSAIDPLDTEILKCHIYLYMHIAVSTSKKKGIRHTYFQGFNKPSTFQMEDYSSLPPMADFRRTIYWSPNVVTDSQGKAQVSFYNNSTCEDMYISVEGLSGDGRFLINE